MTVGILKGEYDVFIGRTAKKKISLCIRPPSLFLPLHSSFLFLPFSFLLFLLPFLIPPLLFFFYSIILSNYLSIKLSIHHLSVICVNMHMKYCCYLCWDQLYISDRRGAVCRAKAVLYIWWSSDLRILGLGLWVVPQWLFYMNYYIRKQILRWSHRVKLLWLNYWWHYKKRESWRYWNTHSAPFTTPCRALLQKYRKEKSITRSRLLSFDQRM